jgi:hypothetical protein
MIDENENIKINDFGKHRSKKKTNATFDCSLVLLCLLIIVKMCFVDSVDAKLMLVFFSTSSFRCAFFFLLLLFFCFFVHVVISSAASCVYHRTK